MARKHTPKKLDHFFKDSQLEYQNIALDLQKRLNTDVSKEVIAFVQVKTNEAMEQVWEKLKNRYDELSKLDESLPNKPTKEDKSRYIKAFFMLTDPKEVSKDLKAALKFNELEKEYLKFIKQLKTQEHGELFKRYIYPTQFFNTLRHSILHHINLLIDSLKSYTDAIQEHIEVLDIIRQESKDKAFIKGGAALLGMFIGIPFAGAGVGALMGNDQTKIDNSINSVFNQWNTYHEDFNKFLKTLEDNYRLAMMTIYGGTILRVNDQLNVYNYTFETMALLSGDYSLTITQQERASTQKWVENSTFGIKQLILNKQWKESIKVSRELFGIVKQRPILARAELYDQKSTLYVAHTAYYLSFQEALLQEYKNGHKEQFFETCKKLYQELPLLIQDKDLEPEFSKQGHLMFRFVKEGMKNGRVEDLIVIPAYWDRLNDRWGSSQFYLGELASSEKNLKNESKALFLTMDFLETVLNIKSKADEGSEELKLHFTPKQLKELRKIDKEIGNPDELTHHLKSEFTKSLLFPWPNFSFDWIKKHRKKLLITSLVATLLFSGIAYWPQVYDFGKETFSTSSDKELLEPPAALPITYLTLGVEHANIRESPSLNGNVVTTVSSSDKIQYLNKDETDSDGTPWHRVLLSDGTEGWISGAISKKQKSD